MLNLPRFSVIILTAVSTAALPLVAQTIEESEKKTNRRAVSENVAAALAASMPKYNPPKAEPEPEESAERPDMREVDKPRNKIIRLPEFVVRQDKPPVFRERDIYTNKGLAELAKKRYLSETSLGLNKFTLPLFGVGAEAYSLMLYQQDERLENMSDLNETADDISLIDPENAAEIRKATRETYDRGFDSNYRTR